MGSDKPISPVTTLSNRFMALRWFSGGRMRHQDDGRAGRSLGARTSSREQSLEFDFVGTSRTIVVPETRESTRTTFWSGSSPVEYTPIRFTVTLGYE
jgi:hypothetical protein